MTKTTVKTFEDRALCLQAAQQALQRNIERRIRRGESVEILKKPYDQNLAWVRCVLAIDGVRTRMVYFQDQQLWRKAG